MGLLLHNHAEGGPRIVLATKSVHEEMTSGSIGNGRNGQVEPPDILISDPHLEPIWEKVQDGERLTADEGVKLLETEDFSSVGLMADYAKRRVSGKKVYFVLNRHLNPTNICVLSCRFCDYAKKTGR